MPSAIIIGGGLIGMLSAAELREAGWQVTLLERGDSGQESSWAGGGILSPLYPWKYPDAVNQLALWSQQHYPALLQRLQQATGMDPELQQCGMLILDETQLQTAQDWGQAHQRRCQLQQAEQLHALEPELSPAFQQAALFPDIGQVRNPRLLKVLRRYMEVTGVQLLEQQGEVELLAAAGQVQAVRAQGRQYQADVVVVAAGAWSAQVLAPLQIQLPVRPVQGQMLLYRLQPGQIRHIVLYRGHYLIPRRDGHVLMGSTVEEVGFEKHTTSAARQELAVAAGEIFPVLRDLQPVQQWAGLRPGSPDGVPFVGKFHGFSNLYVNTGHYRNGVVMGPASAHLLADMLLGRPSALDSAAYLPR